MVVAQEQPREILFAKRLFQSSGFGFERKAI